MTQPKQLPPCPFCGNDKLMRGRPGDTDSFAVRCGRCNAYTSQLTLEQAIEAWSRRASSVPAVQGEAATMRHILNNIQRWDQGTGKNLVASSDGELVCYADLVTAVNESHTASPPAEAERCVDHCEHDPKWMREDGFCHYSYAVRPSSSAHWSDTHCGHRCEGAGPAQEEAAPYSPL